jgi:hypothetical protein
MIAPVNSWPARLPLAIATRTPEGRDLTRRVAQRDGSTVASLRKNSPSLEEKCKLSPPRTTYLVMSPAPVEQESSHWLKTRFANLVWRITPNCRQVTRLASEELDRPLPPGLRARLGLHRRFCPHCARYARQLEVLCEATRRLPEDLEESAEPALTEDAKARMKRALHWQIAEPHSSL